MSNKIIEAKIEFNKNHIRIGIGLIIVSVLLYLFISYIPLANSGYGLNLLGEFVTHHGYDEGGFHPIDCLERFVQFIAPKSSIIFYIAVLCLVTAIYIIFGSIYSRSVSKKCSLSLENTRLIGTKARLFSTKELTLPMNKIDSIHVKNGLMDKLFGGKTVAIRSASGLVKFPWVQNAQEFVDTTLAEIQKYNETVQMKQPDSAPAAESDSLDKIQKLKSLFDQGIISQEEFEAKRKELLEKI